RAFLGPFPWEWRPTPGMLLAVLEGAFWGIALVLSVLYLRRCMSGAATKFQRNASLALMAMTFVMVMVLAVGISNYGMLARLRPIALPMVIPLAVLALDAAARFSQPPRQTRKVHSVRH
ncbi:hypothetical protein, partial [Klebsiella pneumoniae]|uniref:hypothetical protein n=1 Tax=Klebsiella pneumoniae TaxID=573 RepID=UPI001C5CE5D9